MSSLEGGSNSLNKFLDEAPWMETISGFYSKLLSQSNESFSMGKQISKSKCVRKILRSLLERFD